MLTMTTTTPFKRLSRPQNPPSFRITERDITIVRAVAKYRFLSSDQIIRLLGDASQQQVLRRLQLLYYHHFLDRPVHQHMQLSAFAHLVYGLGREGARLLAGDHLVDARQWTTKNNRATSTFLMHTTETAAAMLAIESECSAHNVRLLQQYELLPYFPAATCELRDPFRLRVSMQKDFKSVTINVVPDRVFSIVLPDQRRHNFCLELDRGTMSVRARFSSKLTGYFEGWKQDCQKKQWNFEGYRCITIAPSETRIQNMIAAQRKITADRVAALFLYSTPERIAAHGPLGPAWVNANGEGLALIDGEPH